MPFNADFLNLSFKTVVDALPTALFVKDGNSRIVLMNKACEELWGMTFADLKETDASQFFPADQMASFLSMDRDIFENGRPLVFEEEFWNAKLRENRIGRTVKKPIYDDQGNPLYLVCTTIDITDIKRVENGLRASEEKLRGLYELSPLGIALTDMKGNYVEFNRAFERISGYTRDELNALDYWTLTPKEYEDQELAQLDSLRRTGAYGPYEKDYIRKDGSRIPLSLNGMLVKGSDGESYIWSIVEDITQRKRAAELECLVDTDALLPVANRRAVLRELSRMINNAERHGTPGSVVYVDVNDFKSINDNFGHAAGDAALAHTARVLIENVRNNYDMVGRLGGDEFVAVLAHTDIDQAVAKAEIFESSLARQPLAWMSHAIPLSVSVGVYSFNGRENAERVLEAADQAMYRHKKTRQADDFLSRLQSSGATLEWGAAWLTGNETIDSDHEMLVQYANEFYQAMHSGTGRASAPGILAKLAQYANSHFAREEAIFRQGGLPNLPQHQQAHAELAATVQAFLNDLGSGKATLTADLASFLIEWLINHVFISDKAGVRDIDRLSGKPTIPH